MHQPFCCLFNNNRTIICTNRETILVDKTQCIDPEFVYIWWIGGSISHPAVQLCENDLLASLYLLLCNIVAYIASWLLQDQFYTSQQQQQEGRLYEPQKSFGVVPSLSVSGIYFKSRAAHHDIIHIDYVFRVVRFILVAQLSRGGITWYYRAKCTSWESRHHEYMMAGRGDSSHWMFPSLSLL